MNANDEVNIHSYVVGVCSEEEICDFLFLSISSVVCRNELLDGN